MNQPTTAEKTVLDSLALVNEIFIQDSTALLSSCVEHKGAAGDSHAAYIALISRIVSLAPL